MVAEILLEVDGKSRLGPDDERGPLLDCLPRHRQIAADDPLAQRRIPLVSLGDIALHHRDTNHVARRSRCCERSFCDTPAAPHRAPGDEDRHHDRRRPSFPAAPIRLPGPSPVHNEQRDRRRRQHEQEREAVHARHACELSDRQHGHLAVSKQGPGKAVPDVLTAKLGCHPNRRRAQDRGMNTERPPKSSDGHGERRGKQRQIGDEERRDEERNRSWQAAERGHRLDEPIEGSGEVADAGEQAQEERAPRRPRRARTYQSRARTYQSNDERGQGQPRAGGMAVLREAERQQRAR